MESLALPVEWFRIELPAQIVFLFPLHIVWLMQEIRSSIANALEFFLH